MIQILDYISDKNKTHVLWDWNGTLLNDVDMCVEVLREMADLYHVKSISKETYRNFYCFPTEDFYKKVGFDFKNYDYAELTEIFIRKYVSHVYECELFAGTKDVLLELNKTGIACSILSAASKDHLDEVVPKFGIKNLLQNIFGASDDAGAGKIELGKKVFDTMNIDKKTAILIGDTLHDAEVAKAVGIDVVLLTGGHQAKKVLKNSGGVVLERI